MLAMDRIYNSIIFDWVRARLLVRYIIQERPFHFEFVKGNARAAVSFGCHVGSVCQRCGTRGGPAGERVRRPSSGEKIRFRIQLGNPFCGSRHVTTKLGLTRAYWTFWWGLFPRSARPRGPFFFLGARSERTREQMWHEKSDAPNAGKRTHITFKWWYLHVSFRSASRPRVDCE